MATRTTPTPKRTRRRRVHPLVAASTLLPVGLGVLPSLINPTTTAPQGTTQTVAVSSVAVGAACTLPFDAIKEHHPIDDSCPAEGTATTAPQAAQNEAKNDFCETGPTRNITFAALRQLQADVVKAHISFGGDTRLPRNRSVLRNLPTDSGSLSEGDVVRIVAFVVDAHPSNDHSGGESVNCKQNGVDFNDIHIVLGENSNKDDPCSSVTAEMSPHFRPAAWNATALNDNNEHLYRFTGHLFFDASHLPCKGGQPVGRNPKRSSLWEIHPVYGVEICADAGNNCKVDSDENWIPFDTGADGSETRLQLPDEIKRTFGTSRMASDRR